MSKRKVYRKTKPRPTRKTTRRGQTVSAESLVAAVEANPSDIGARLRLCEFYLRNDAEAKVIEALDGVDRESITDSLQLSLFDRFTAYGHAHRNEYIEAERFARFELERAPESLDALFVLSFVHLSLREWGQAVESAEAFVRAWRTTAEEDRARYLASTHAFLAQVYNFLGSVAYDLEDTPVATGWFEQAIATDPTNHLPYLNLANLYNHTEQPDKARVTVAEGLRHCLQVHELRLLSESMRTGEKVSACLIVKNEEELLPGCLDSIRDWVDEIIVVDTGSTDRTVEIAESYGARVFHQPWEGDFSKHRNYSIDQAGGDWILIIDADERMTAADIPPLQRHLAEHEADIIAVNVLNVGGKFEEQVTFLPSIRLFRRELGLRYEGIVHNQLKIDPSQPVLRTAATIKHLGYGLSPDKLRAKAERTIALLDRQLAENPDNAFALFNYAQVILGLGLDTHPDNPNRVIDAARRAMELTDPNRRGERHIHLMALQQLAMAHFLTGKYEAAENYALNVLDYKDDYLDPILLLGNIYLRLDRLDRSERYFRRYLDTQAAYDESRETEDIIVVHPRSRHHARYGLGLIAERRQDWAAAEREFEAVVKSVPDFIDTNTRLGYAHLQSGRYTEAADRFDRQLKGSPSAHDAAVGRALLAYRFGDDAAGDRLVRQALDNVAPGDPVAVRHANKLEQIGKTTEAEWFLDRCAEADPSGQPIARHLAEAYFRIGRYHDAARLYRSLIDRGETDPALYNDLGGCLYKVAQYAEAEKFYRTAAESPAAPALALRNLGLARVQLGRVQEALVALEQYVESAPDQLDIVRLVGDLHARRGDYDIAIPFYEKCLQANPRDASALFSLSECYLLMGHRDSAIVGYRRVLELEPSHPAAQKRLTELLETVSRA